MDWLTSMGRKQSCLDLGLDSVRWPEDRSVGQNWNSVVWLFTNLLHPFSSTCTSTYQRSQVYTYMLSAGIPTQFNRGRLAMMMRAAGLIRHQMSRNNKSYSYSYCPLQQCYENPDTALRIAGAVLSNKNSSWGLDNHKYLLNMFYIKVMLNHVRMLGLRF